MCERCWITLYYQIEKLKETASKNQLNDSLVQLWRKSMDKGKLTGINGIRKRFECQTMRLIFDGADEKLLSFNRSSGILKCPSKPLPHPQHHATSSLSIFQHSHNCSKPSVSFLLSPNVHLKSQLSTPTNKSISLEVVGAPKTKFIKWLNKEKAGCLKWNFAGNE